MSVKQQFTEEEIYKDRDSQIAAIEKTFEDAQKSVSSDLIRSDITIASDRVILHLFFHLNFSDCSTLQQTQSHTCGGAACLPRLQGYTNALSHTYTRV